MKVPPHKTDSAADWQLPLRTLVRSAAAAQQTLLITGTDTGVDKTTLSARLLNLAAAEGLRAAWFKPFETGCEPRGGMLASSELELVLRAAGAAVGVRIGVSYRLSMPTAPYTAAMKAGVLFDWSRLDGDFARLRDGSDLLLVEGAGGLLVPIEQNFTYLNLLQRWTMLPVLVVGNRLGCINHALLTDAVLRRAGYLHTPIVLNEVHCGEPSASEATNLWTLAAVLARPIMTHPFDPAYSHASVGKGEAP